tara:strand:+ start:377 stop:796 length:420 start_codon:yes stop_codon:yes gene_type:complete
MKQIKLLQNLPFASCPALIDVDDDAILVGDAEGPNGAAPWVIGNTFGAMCMIWARCEQDALDGAVDAGRFMMDSCLLEDSEIEVNEDGDEIDVCRLGNAGEPFCLNDVWMGQVDISSLGGQFWFELGVAQGAGQDTLHS